MKNDPHDQPVYTNYYTQIRHKERDDAGDATRISSTEPAVRIHVPSRLTVFTVLSRASWQVGGLSDFSPRHCQLSSPSCVFLC